jgi:hypothetical protein
MTAPVNVQQQSKVVRLIYSAMVAGVLLMAVVGQLVLRPKMPVHDPKEFPPAFRLVILAAIFAAPVGSFLWFRKQVPKRKADQSADAFWMKAAGPALVGWAIAEGACLMGVVIYAVLGFADAVAIAALAFIYLIMMNPSRIESA